MSSQDDILRVVFDCMIYLQATANENSPAAAALRLFDAGEIALYVSPAILSEIADVLNRPKVRQKNSRITDVNVEALLKRLADKAVVLKNVPEAFKYSRDPKDEPYINLAVAVGAQYLVSRDKDLLDLMTDYTQECKEFRQRFRPLKVVDPVAFLKEFVQGNAQS
ncbi:MAG: putative toxin-antitoxin system toxin component, PIN family [Acidobacteriota bacterium]